MHSCRQYHSRISTLPPAASIFAWAPLLTRCTRTFRGTLTSPRPRMPRDCAGLRSKRACSKAGGVTSLPAPKCRQLVQVDFVVFHPVEGCKAFTTHERQAAEERQVAALVVQAGAATRAGALAFGTPTGSLTLPGRNAATNAFAIFLRTFLWFKIVSVSSDHSLARVLRRHSRSHTTSSTSTRW